MFNQLYKLAIYIIAFSVILSCRSFVVKKDSTSGNQNWIQFGGKPGRNNYQQTTIAPPLKNLWIYTASSAVSPTLVVVDGVVYFGTLDGKIEAVRVADGGKLGKKNSEGHFETTLAYYEGNLFLAARYGEKTLSKYNLEKGKYLWQIDAGDIASEPLVTTDGVYISALYNHIDKYDLNSGETIWTYKTADQHRSSPALSENVLVVGCDNGVLYALDAQSGILSWELNTGASIFATPVIHDKVIYVGSADSNFYAVSLENGEIKWRFDAGAPLYQTAATNGKYVLFGASDSWFYCLEAATGKQIWNFKAEHLISTAPAIAGSVVYFGSLDRGLYCLNLIDGEKIWRQETKGRIRTSPVIWNDHIFWASENKYVYAFIQSNGSKPNE